MEDGVLGGALVVEHPEDLLVRVPVVDDQRDAVPLRDRGCAPGTTPPARPSPRARCGSGRARSPPRPAPGAARRAGRSRRARRRSPCRRRPRWGAARRRPARSGAGRPARPTSATTGRRRRPAPAAARSPRPRPRSRRRRRRPTPIPRARRRPAAPPGRCRGGCGCPAPGAGSGSGDGGGSPRRLARERPPSRLTLRPTASGARARSLASSSRRSSSSTIDGSSLVKIGVGGASGVPDGGQRRGRPDGLRPRRSAR